MPNSQAGGASRRVVSGSGIDGGEEDLAGQISGRVGILHTSRDEPLQILDVGAVEVLEDVRVAPDPVDVHTCPCSVRAETLHRNRGGADGEQRTSRARGCLWWTGAVEEIRTDPLVSAPFSDLVLVDQSETDGTAR